LFGTWTAFVPGQSVADPASNTPVAGSTSYGGAGSDPFLINVPGTTSVESYGAEARWNVGQAAGVVPGHKYRAQAIMHDGDQNKAGGDVGEACTTFTVPVAGVVTHTSTQANAGADGGYHIRVPINTS